MSNSENCIHFRSPLAKSKNYCPGLKGYKYRTCCPNDIEKPLFLDVFTYTMCILAGYSVPASAKSYSGSFVFFFLLLLLFYVHISDLCNFHVVSYMLGWVIRGPSCHISYQRFVTVLTSCKLTVVTR